MVRPERGRAWIAWWRCCIRLAGASPAAVSAGAPRGWGNYFRTGNASWKFQQVDRYVNQRLVRLLPHARGWRRRPFELRSWAPARFVAEFGLHRLVGTIRYPGFANAS